MSTTAIKGLLHSQATVINVISTTFVRTYRACTRGAGAICYASCFSQPNLDSLDTAIHADRQGLDFRRGQPLRNSPDLWRSRQLLTIALHLELSIDAVDRERR